ncbi:MAG: ion channel, partial [Candidatus Kariarchaeaceae archaeon]
MATRQSIEEFPKRGKFALIIITLVFSMSIYAFMVFEKLSFLDSLYFLIVTVSTVGFGDIEPTHSFTKIILMLLIVTGISTIAILSETAIDKIVTMRSAGNYDIPENSLDLKNHIVFSQFNHIVERMALFAQDRFFDVVILDRDEDAVKHARRKGFVAYLGEAENPQTLELLSLENACALYLFLDDDNLIIQSAILAENLAPNLLIYASTNEHLSIDYGKIVGITRTYHNERLLGSFIS